ncbi:HupE/UreJ family protein [Dinoroseobacter sp. PD6]|uniref:HupE/UreJ family protein n=1 Tax=Dinoroseobacter sp. PD6 TaxID=3028384 RepID=UPI00237BA9AA|nr:HupE/UreJ family protein [Dinoroseobacter sp. PD6]MDD9717842.1 HupE/UreJ family protein [Dinoroseobacter sp. PD6]
MERNLRGWVRLRVACWMLVSMALLRAAQAGAHEIRPAVADVIIGPDRAEVVVQLTAEALVAGIDVTGIEDTDEAPEAEVYDALRALPPDEMAAALRAAWPEVARGFIAEVDGARLDWVLRQVRIADEPELELPRDTQITAEIALPPGEAPVVLGWVAANGPLVVRQNTEDGGEGYSGYLTDGALSAPLPRTGTATQSIGAAFFDYIGIGFAHIVPKGLDHILFVLGLFFFRLALKPLVFQVTAFTLAHTVTLALATLGLVSVPPAIVEPLIAISIVYIAVENILGGAIGWRRTAVVFGFGLLHGLGFASVLGEIGLDPARFLTGLIGFNIGVELGQLAVLAAAFVLLGLPFGRMDWYRRAVAVPASVGIALVGAWWAVERVFL